jgi:polar amino acid transport system substrate-binding protein
MKLPRPSQLVAVVTLVALVLLPSCRGPETNTIETIRQRGALRWGADEEGGAPYAYRSPTDPNKLIGFEVDLMAQIAAGLGVESQFVQGEWKNLLNTLAARDVDVLFNGFELTRDRLRTASATIPYYVYELVLFVHRDDKRLTDWEGLKRPRPDGRKWRIGVLDGTAAAKYLADQYESTVEIIQFNGTTDAFRDVQSQNIDGTLTDTPPAIAYGQSFPVRQVGLPAERGYYVIYVRKGDDDLREALNAQLRAMIADGRLKAVLKKYGLWSASQEDLASNDIQQLPETMKPEGGETDRWAVVRRNLPRLLRGAGLTVLISVVSMPLAIALGLLIALGRVYGPAMFRFPLAVYVELVRGTPLVLQLFFLHFGLMPLVLPPEWRSITLDSIVALSLNYAAYEAEIYRAGLLAIPVGQMEAALALGLTRRQAIWHVIVPQAVRLVIPPVTNDFINLFKDTAVCSVIAAEELSKSYNILVNNHPQAFLELALVTAALYLLMSYPLSLVTRRLEKKTIAARA